MTPPIRRLALVGIAALVAACAGPVTVDGPGTFGPGTSTAVESATPDATAAAADPTPVPVPVTPKATGSPEPVPTRTGVTDTTWGTIVDAVPPEWPVYPGAKPVESDEGPASGAWLAPADVETVAPWYRRATEEAGYTTGALSSPLEDGTRILDTVTDLPECRIQTTFRPADGSTRITVLYGAGCAGGDG